ncbi:MAG: undecaprenyldiphospho-muramoylpentapeptide beta-N-acetylglucosaminyltransferase [Eubacteriales bacterium]|nr:undecaprenyldiphospho-muramoylpentapeptide beta-N-acetylglucosaminyltransferase [Eubacteriales bacterium]MDD4323380.1 undecaprenyldiphospho-muramoylpentapeptide beta-N-acetylglucosaminyltransferase [Eubacteriales bacterium]MDD4541685.1 undecaprenyldiphospho-muramoylpentapeptide beta-N-acetylglucosaminyltransferase [Eubacteriales bacterium]
MKTSQNNSKKTVVFAAGGTSGHIHPALAIASEIRDRNPDVRIIFCGLKGNIEEEMVPAAGYEFVPVSARGIPTKYSPRLFRWVKDNIQGIRTARLLMRKVNPVLVIGTGGYVTGPVIMAAMQYKIPYVLHEQNVSPGRANRFFARRADHVFVINEASKNHFPVLDTITVSGNPVQPDFLSLDKEQGRHAVGISEERFLIVVTGGSLGALRLNKAVSDLRDHPEWLSLVEEHPELIVMLSTGKEIANTPAVYEGISNVQVTNYLYNMAQWMAASDLVISRSGAMTCAELVALAKPSILVPYPQAVDDHQTKNAQTLADLGGAIMVKDEDFDSDYLVRKIRYFINRPEQLQKMSEALSSADKTSAAELIYQKIAPYLSEKNNGDEQNQ